MKIKSIKQIVGKAIGRYNREQHADCTGYVDFSWPAGGFTVRTMTAKGDNVPWARKPMDSYIWGALDRAGYSADFKSETHCKGSVSMAFSRKG